MDRSSKQKINKETLVLNDTLDEMDLIDICRTFHPNAEVYTFFSSAHETFSKIGHILGHKSKLSKFKKNWSHIKHLLWPQRTWKQPRCPSTDEWIKKLWYIYTVKYYSAIKRNAFESVLMRWMNLEPIIQSEMSLKEKDKYCIQTHIYGI